eukprot:gene7452-8718_t
MEEYDVIEVIGEGSFGKVYKSFETVKEICLVLEYALGDLASVLAHDYPAPEQFVQAVSAQLVTALYFIHTNRIWMYGGMRPSNIMIGPGGAVKLADYGLGMARQTPPAQQYLTHEMEDLESLGRMLYTLAIGPPEPVLRFPLTTSPDLVSLLQGLLANAVDSDAASAALRWPELLNHPFVQVDETMGWRSSYRRRGVNSPPSTGGAQSQSPKLGSLPLVLPKVDPKFLTKKPTPVSLARPVTPAVHHLMPASPTSLPLNPISTPHAGARPQRITTSRPLTPIVIVNRPPTPSKTSPKYSHPPMAVVIPLKSPPPSTTSPLLAHAAPPLDIDSTAISTPCYETTEHWETQEARSLVESEASKMRRDRTFLATLCSHLQGINNQIEIVAIGCILRTLSTLFASPQQEGDMLFQRSIFSSLVSLVQSLLANMGSISTTTTQHTYVTNELVTLLREGVSCISLFFEHSPPLLTNILAHSLVPPLSPQARKSSSPIGPFLTVLNHLTKNMTTYSSPPLQSAIISLLVRFFRKLGEAPVPHGDIYKRMLEHTSILQNTCGFIVHLVEDDWAAGASVPPPLFADTLHTFVAFLHTSPTNIQEFPLQMGGPTPSSLAANSLLYQTACNMIGDGLAKEIVIEGLYLALTDSSLRRTILQLFLHCSRASRSFAELINREERNILELSEEEFCSRHSLIDYIVPSASLTNDPFHHSLVLLTLESITIERNYLLTNNEQLIATIDLVSTSIPMKNIRKLFGSQRTEGGKTLRDIEGGCFGRPYLGLLDGCACILLRLLKREGTSFLENLLESGVWEAVCHQLSSPEGDVELSPSGVIYALRLVYEVVSKSSSHITLLARNSLLVSLCGLLKPVHLERLKEWPTIQSGGSNGLCALVTQIICDESPSTSLHELIRYIMLGNDLTKHLILLLPQLPLESLDLPLGLLSTLILEDSQFADQFIEYGGLEPQTLNLLLNTDNQLARISEDNYKLLQKSDICLCIGKLLVHHDASVRSKTCNLIGNLFKHNSYFYQPMLRSGIIPALIDSCSDFDSTTRKFACFAIGNAAFHTSELYQALEPCIEALTSILDDEGEDEKTRSNVAGAIGNLVRNSSELCQRIINHDTLGVMVNNLHNPALTKNILFSLGNLSMYDECKLVLVRRYKFKRF